MTTVTLWFLIVVPGLHGSGVPTTIAKFATEDECKISGVLLVDKNALDYEYKCMELKVVKEN